MGGGCEHGAARGHVGAVTARGQRRLVPEGVPVVVTALYVRCSSVQAAVNLYLWTLTLTTAHARTATETNLSHILVQSCFCLISSL